MLINEMLSKAIAITAKEFDGVLDKGGTPYILHCIEVMNGVIHLGHEVMAAAVMHDLVEDTSWTFVQLIQEGFSEKIVSLVDLCTHRKGSDYLEYIGRISTNSEARAIKLADLRHNMRPDRLVDLTDKSMARMRKYHTAYQFLTKLN